MLSNSETATTEVPIILGFRSEFLAVFFPEIKNSAESLFECTSYISDISHQKRQICHHLKRHHTFKETRRLISLWFSAHCLISQKRRRVIVMTGCVSQGPMFGETSSVWSASSVGSVLDTDLDAAETARLAEIPDCKFPNTRKCLRGHFYGSIGAVFSAFRELIMKKIWNVTVDCNIIITCEVWIFFHTRC